MVQRTGHDSDPTLAYSVRMEIQPLSLSDVDRIAAAFDDLGWPGKGVELYRRYLEEQESGEREVFVAHVDGGFAGYVCVVWHSDYEPFRAAEIPEILDFNVLPAVRRRGIGTALMDAAEDAVVRRSPIAGLGCGLYADYGAALLLYLNRGYVPDGRGVAYGGKTVTPGETIRIDDSAALMFTKRVG